MAQTTAELLIKQGEAQGIVKGEAQGIVKGEAQGLVKGEAQGLVKGKVEGCQTGRCPKSCGTDFNRSLIRFHRRLPRSKAFQNSIRF